MAQSIIPDSHSNRLDFFQNLKQQIADNAATLGLDAAALLAINAVLDPLIATYQVLVDAEQAVVAANADAAQVFTQQVKPLRAIIDQLKTNPKLTDGMGEDMRIFTSATTHNPQDTKPSIKASAQPGHVTITGSKDYAELVDIYMSIAGTTAWALVGVRRRKFPFDDQTPLKTPGTPEQREYQARGIIGEDEVGQPSDIVTVVFGG
jgi:hypothetical protein